MHNVNGVLSMKKNLTIGILVAVVVIVGVGWFV